MMAPHLRNAASPHPRGHIAASSLLALVAALATPWSTAASRAPLVSVPRLPAELHGFNSLDAWPQLLVKGARWLKVDIGVVTRASCEAFSSWAVTGNRSLCFTERGVEYCCLGLSGDTGSRPNLLDPFNTTDELITFLASPSNAPLLPMLPLPAGARPLMIGLDAGGSPGGCISGCAAAPLFRSFLLQWAALLRTTRVAAYGANDNGFAGWFSDLDTACATGCAGDDAAIHGLPFVSQAGASWGVPPGPAAARVQVVNEDVTDFASCCKSNCWRDGVAQSAAFPWLWYEQTGQADFTSFVAEWRACATLPAARAANISSQLAMVSNMATEAFEVFSAPSNALGRGVNVGALGAQYGRPWLLATPAGGSAAGEAAFVVLAATAANGSSSPAPQLFLTRAAPGSAPGHLERAALPLHAAASGVGSGAAGATGAAVGARELAAGALDVIPGPGEVSAGSGGLMAEGQLVALSWAAVATYDEDTDTPSRYRLMLSATDDGLVTVCSFDTQEGALSPVGSTWTVPLPVGGALLAGAVACTAPLSAPTPSASDTNALPCAFAAVTSAGTRGAGPLTLTVTALGGGPALARALLTGPHAPPADRGATVALVWDDAAGAFGGLAAWSTSANETGWLSPGGTGTRAYLYASALSLSLVGVATGPPSAATVASSPPPPPSGAPPRVGLGAVPRATAARVNGTAALLLTSTDGTCDAALYTNNADMLRCALALPAFDGNLFYSAFQTVPRLLQYDYAPLGAWRALVASNGTQHLSLCSRSIVHGKFERGTSASGALLPWAPALDGQPPRGASFALLAAHDAGAPELPAPQWLLCGLPAEKEGVVWDSFALVDVTAFEDLEGGEL